MKIWESGSVWCVNCYRNAVFWSMCCRETFFCLWYGFLNSLSKMETKLLSQGQGVVVKKEMGGLRRKWVDAIHLRPLQTTHLPRQTFGMHNLLLTWFKLGILHELSAETLNWFSSRAGMRGFLWVVVFLDLGRLCLNEWICRNWRGTSGIC